MTSQPQGDKKTKAGMIVVRFPEPIYTRLQQIADEKTAAEGRAVTVTELVRRQALELAQSVAA